MSHNIHNLIHLAEDVRTYGALDVFGAFRFENHMGKLKKMIRKADKPLQQLAKRFSELENIESNRKYLNNKSKLTNSVHLQNKHTKGPLTQSDIFNLPINQYKKIMIPDKLSIHCDSKNCFCHLKDGSVVFIKNIVETITDKDVIYIIGYKMKIIDTPPFYSTPCESFKINIKTVTEKKNSSLQCWNILDIHAKVWRMPYKDKFVIVPIIHSYL